MEAIRLIHKTAKEEDAQREVTSGEEENKGLIPTATIKNRLKKWEEVLAKAKQRHPYHAELN